MDKKLFNLISVSLLCLLVFFCSSCGFSNEIAKKQIVSSIEQSVKDMPEKTKIDLDIKENGDLNEITVKCCTEKSSDYSHTESHVQNVAMIIFKNCYTAKISISNVTINVYATELDNYGNDRNSYLATFTMFGETGKMINWDNYDKLSFNQVVNKKEWDKEFLDKLDNEHKWHAAYFLRNIPKNSK